ncbi:hypothetical protein EV562_10336 [Streptomyces sp. BK208]|uniref:DUF6342 family protein n=1 Tax=Streptomyces sp. BK208 TaxID=2512150 RepID=UPI00106011A3|nr:DUF6342 family protein [Streptomyces sp. BK208]TDT39666.1 hypothetical protein EV562_10336 [Streptomyces sp. BK208]
MPDIDLGVASDVKTGDYNGRVKLTQSRVYPDSEKKDVLISGPESIELSVNTNHSSSQEADKFFFTTHHGSQERILAVLDSSGNLRLAGRLITEQKNLTY